MVEGEGFEPSKAEPADLQSDPFDRSGTPPLLAARLRTCLLYIALRRKAGLMIRHELHFGKYFFKLFSNFLLIS